ASAGRRGNESAAEGCRLRAHCGGSRGRREQETAPGQRRTRAPALPRSALRSMPLTAGLLREQFSSIRANPGATPSRGGAMLTSLHVLSLPRPRPSCVRDLSDDRHPQAGAALARRVGTSPPRDLVTRARNRLITGPQEDYRRSGRGAPPSPSGKCRLRGLSSPTREPITVSARRLTAKSYTDS